MNGVDEHVYRSTKIRLRVVPLHLDSSAHILRLFSWMYLDNLPASLSVETVHTTIYSVNSGTSLLTTPWNENTGHIFLCLCIYFQPLKGHLTIWDTFHGPVVSGLSTCTCTCMYLVYQDGRLFYCFHVFVRLLQVYHINWQLVTT